MNKQINKHFHSNSNWNTMKKKLNLASTDQDNPEWLHHPWIFGQVDPAYQVSRHDTGCVSRPLPGKGGTSRARRLLYR